MARSRRQTKVLLLEDTETLGEVGDIVDVKPGYARNFLFPTGVACPLTPEALRQVERAKEQAARLRAQRAAQVAELSTALSAVSLTLEERASDEGHLFGSVGAAQIVASLGERGISIEEKQVLLDHPIKELGIFNVPIRLDAENSAEIRVWVVEPST